MCAQDPRYHCIHEYGVHRSGAPEVTFEKSPLHARAHTAAGCGPNRGLAGTAKVSG